MSALPVRQSKRPWKWSISTSNTGLEILDKIIPYLRSRGVKNEIYCGGGILTPEHARINEALMKTVIKYAPIAMEDPTNYEARANLLYCSSWGNNGYVVKGKPVNWSVHALEHELTSFNDTTHGDGLAVLTPRWMRWVIEDPSKKWRFVEMGVNVWGIDPNLPEDEIVEKCIEAVEDWFWNKLHLHKNLRELGIKEEDLEMFASQVDKKLGYLQGCYRPYTAEAIRRIYHDSF